jgi:hypothetical protein
MTREQMLQQQASARVYQERYDSSLQPWDLRAPAPVLGEDISEYRARLAILAKKQLPEDHELRKIQYRRLDSRVFDNFEPQLLQAVQKAAYDATSVPPGQFRQITEVDGNGNKVVKFVGPRSFVEDFKAPVRRVLSFQTPNGRVNAAGSPVR